MKYKSKLVFLISLISACVLILIASFIFNPQNQNARTSLYTWLNRTWTLQADRIVLKGIGSASETIMLTRKFDRWNVLVDNTEYPAKQELVDDLFNLLSARESYPMRASSVSSHERLGVTEQLASRIIVYGGASQIPLLDLLIGSGNSAGTEIYLRKNGTNEVRSGIDQFTQYSDAKQNAWYDLRLVNDDETLNGERVQQVMINRNDCDENISYTISRYTNNNTASWKINTSLNMTLDNYKVDSYIRTLLTSEAVDFSLDTHPSKYNFNFGKIDLVLDDLSTTTYLFAQENGNAQYPTMVSGKNFVYLIPEWLVQRIFRDVEYFSAEESR
jgi:hypothetical protein